MSLLVHLEGSSLQQVVRNRRLKWSGSRFLDDAGVNLVDGRLATWMDLAGTVVMVLEV